MNGRIRWGTAAASVAITFLLVLPAAFGKDLVQRSCAQLVRSAQEYQQDLKTVDMVLGSAIDSGYMDQVRSYKLKKWALEKKLAAVLKAIKVKGCVEVR